MLNKYGILVCETLRREVAAVVANYGITDIKVIPFVLDCCRPGSHPDRLRRILLASSNRFDNLLLLGGQCTADVQLPETSVCKCNITRMHGCFSLLIPEILVQQYQSSGAYLLTPGWLHKWRRHIDNWGFDQQTARVFFAESCNRLILLDTGLDTQSRVQLAEFSAYIDRPYEALSVGLEMLRLHLTKFVNECNASPKQTASPDTRIADYGLVFDTMSRIVGHETEEKVVRAIFELFDMICAPGLSGFLPFRNNQPETILTSPTTASIPADTIAEMMVLDKNYAWTSSGAGFIFKLQREHEKLGIWLIEGIALSQHKEHYLNLTLNILPAIVMAISNARNLEQLTESREALREQQEELATTLRSIGDAVISTDTQGLVVQMNPVAEELTGWVMSEAAGQPISNVLHIINTQTNEPAFLPVDSVLATGEVYHLEDHTTLISRSGVERQITDSAAPIRGADGAISGVVLVFSDITEYYSAQKAIQTEKHNLEAIFAASPVSMLLMDEEATIVNTNVIFANMLSKDVSEIICKQGGLGLGCIYSYENEMGCGYASACQDCHLMQNITHVLNTGTAIHGVELQTTLLIDGQEQRPWLRISAEPIILNGRNHVIIAMDDITKRKMAEESLAKAKDELENLNYQLEQALFEAHQHATEVEVAKDHIEESAVRMHYQARHDALTDLPNRLLFSEELENTLQNHRAKTKQCAVLFLDLDKFKMVNDTMGHKAGDILLTQTADRLRSCLRHNDILARMGGDEFTVLLKDIVSTEDAAIVAQRMLEQVATPYEINGSKLVIGVSIGGSFYPENATDSVGLLKAADVAMYKAKEMGRNNCQFFSEEISQESHTRIEIERDLRLAIERDEMKVFYQPIIDVKTMKIAGAEALLRWNHPDKGIISPGLFIPIAEEAGLILEVGKMVVEKACKQCRIWQDMGFADFEMSVNVSPAQLGEIGIISEIDGALSDSHLSPNSLKLEVTETVLAKNDNDEVDILSILRSLGVVICLDDFGIGYSSLSRLNSLPIGHMKIDGCFIRNIAHNRKDRAMTESIIVMAHNLGIKVTAEWIEDEEQMATIKSLNCDYAQGYYISPALPADDFSRFLQEWNKNQKVA